MAAADPPQGPPVRLNIDKLFCPRQDGIQDIHVHEYDIAGGMIAYSEMLKAMKRRQRNIAPFTVGGDLHIPVTPLENPKTGLSSHFIIRIVNSEDPQYSVDCLIRDTDLYFMAFRRRLVLTLEEEEALAEERRRREEAAGSSSSKKSSKKQYSQQKMRKAGWGTWYRFEITDLRMRIPNFLEAVYCGISNGYDNDDLVTPGSLTGLYDMLVTLGKFEDNPVPNQSLQRACYRVMTTICEPCRLRTVLKEIVNRFKYNLQAHTLSESLMDDMRAWTQLGAVALDWHNKGDSSFKLPNWCSKHNVNNIDDLIGKKGIVLLIRADPTRMAGVSEKDILEITDKAIRRNNGPADRVDAGFPPPPLPPPPPPPPAS